MKKPTKYQNSEKNISFSGARTHKMISFVQCIMNVPYNESTLATCFVKKSLVTTSNWQN